MSSASRRLLAIYLNDHLAGATGGVALAKRLARSHHGTEFERPTAELAEQVEQDRASLLEIMRALDVPTSRVKGVLAVLLERVGRLKLNGALVRRSRLSSVIELEAMHLGVEGKIDGWQTLRRVAESEQRLNAGQLDELLRRAAEQSDTLQDLRLRAVANTFVR